MEIKHNLKGAVGLGLIVSISFLVILGLAKGFSVPYISNIPLTYIATTILCVGVYISWSNYYLRKIVVEGKKCVYINMFGKRKDFLFDDIGDILFKDNDNVFIYDINGIKICKIESNMMNLEKLYEQFYIKKGSISECSKEELGYRVKEKYKDFTSYLQTFVENTEKLNVVLEYGFQIEENDNSIFYILKFRAKNEGKYLAQNFLKIGRWEYSFVYIGYKKERQITLYCEEESLRQHIQQLFKELYRVKRRNNIMEKSTSIPYKMMQEINV